MNLTSPPGRPPASACAHAQALARRTSWWLPGDLAAFASSPPGKKNSRGASRLRQIKRGYNLSPQVRRGVTERRRMGTAAPVRRDRMETVLGCVLSPRDLPRRQPRQTPQAAGHRDACARIGAKWAHPDAIGTALPDTNWSRKRWPADRVVVADDGQRPDYADGEIRGSRRELTCGRERRTRPCPGRGPRRLDRAASAGMAPSDNKLTENTDSASATTQGPWRRPPLRC